MRLEYAINATEMNSGVASAFLLDVLKSMQSQTQERNRMSAGQIDAIAGKIRNMPREQMKDNVMVSLAHTYRELLSAILSIRFAPLKGLKYWQPNAAI